MSRIVANMYLGFCYVRRSSHALYMQYIVRKSMSKNEIVVEKCNDSRRSEEDY